MTRATTLAAAALVALVLSACGSGDDTAGNGDDATGNPPAESTEDQAGGSEDESSDESSDDSGDDDSSHAVAVPADQTEITADDVCAAIPVNDLPFDAGEVSPADDPADQFCFVNRADNYDSFVVTFWPGTSVDGSPDVTAVTIDGRDGAVKESDNFCFVQFPRGEDVVSVEIQNSDDSRSAEVCQTAQDLAEAIAPNFPES